MERCSLSTGSGRGGEEMVLSGANFLPDSKVVFIERGPGKCEPHPHHLLPAPCTWEAPWEPQSLPPPHWYPPNPLFTVPSVHPYAQETLGPTMPPLPALGEIPPRTFPTRLPSPLLHSSMASSPITSLLSDGKLQWEEEACINRLKSNEVRKSQSGSTLGEQGGGQGKSWS